MAEQDVEDFSLKSFFVPLKTYKVINIIVIIGLIVFGNMLFNDFVWDDKTYILQYPLVHSVNIIALFDNNIYNIGPHYRPLAAVYFASLYSLFANISFPYHVFQLILHCANTILVFVLFKEFFNKKLAFFLSIIFLVHPIQVESVSYITSSNNPLFFLFGISALLLSRKKVLSLKRLIAICFLLIMSLLSKETGILFFFIIVLLQIVYKRSQLVILIGAEVATLLVYLLLRFSVVGIYYEQLAVSPIAGLTFTERLINIPAIIFYYLKTFFYPAQLAIEQFWVYKSVDINAFFLPLLMISFFFLLVLFLGLFIFKTKRKAFPVFLFFSMWFVLGLGIYAQIVPLDYTVADRWFYFPIVGLLGIIGSSLQVIHPPSRKIQIIGWVLGITLLMLLSARTMVRNTNWSDAIMLYTHDRKIVESHDLETNLGTEYFNRKNYPLALVHHKKSEEIFPFEVNRYNIAATYVMLGNYTKAKEYYWKILEQKQYYYPEFQQASLEALTKVEVFHEKPTTSTIAFIKKGLQRYPNSGYLWAALAYSEYNLHNNAEALAAAEKAKTILRSSQAEYLYDQIATGRPIELNKLTNTAH